MKCVGILGSGFGIYGYLPALIQIGVNKVFLPIRYQTAFFSRHELKIFENYVCWSKDERQMLSIVDSVVVALPPSFQSAYVKILIKLPNIKNIILEKPLDINPELSWDLLEKLKISNKKFCIGYNFRYSSWCPAVFGKSKINSFVQTERNLEINWDFLAPHYKNNSLIWKRYHSLGGGILRFYGIHLIALLSEYGYSDVVTSNLIGPVSDDYTKWNAIFSGNGLPLCEVNLNSRSDKKEFHILETINTRKKILVKQQDPFEVREFDIKYGIQDRRVPYLIDCCQSLINEDKLSSNWYKDAIILWGRVEKTSNFCED